MCHPTAGAYAKVHASLAHKWCGIRFGDLNFSRGSNRRSRSREDAVRLWQVSEELTGLRYLDD